MQKGHPASCRKWFDVRCSEINPDDEAAFFRVLDASLHSEVSDLAGSWCRVRGEGRREIQARERTVLSDMGSCRWGNECGNETRLHDGEARHDRARKISDFPSPRLPRDLVSIHKIRRKTLLQGT